MHFKMRSLILNTPTYQLSSIFRDSSKITIKFQPRVAYRVLLIKKEEHKAYKSQKSVEQVKKILRLEMSISSINICENKSGFCYFNSMLKTFFSFNSRTLEGLTEFRCSYKKKCTVHVKGIMRCQTIVVY